MTIRDFTQAFPTSSETKVETDPFTNARNTLIVITRLLDQLSQAETSARAASQELINAGICTGTVYWRSDTATPTMYANHPIAASCPVHGEPKTRRGRIRYYIGTDPAAQAETIQQQQNAADLDQVNDTLARLQSALTRATWALTDAESRLSLAL